MSDPLDLIAEARRRQEDAERERDYWKARSDHSRARLKLVFELLKHRNIKPLPMSDEPGMPKWEPTRRAVADFVQVVSNPYYRYNDDDGSITHETAADMLTFRIQRIVKATIENAQGEP